MRSRRGPLHACGVSTLAIALSLYKKAIELNGPIYWFGYKASSQVRLEGG